jgi:hypothetical protein
MMPGVLCLTPRRKHPSLRRKCQVHLLYGDYHYAVKELLEPRDYLAQGMGKTRFSGWTREEKIDRVIDKACRGSEVPLGAFWCKVRV